MSSVSQYSIVVGVDGSPASKAALRWALRHALLLGGTVTTLMARDYPAIYAWEIPGPENFDQSTARALAEVVDEVAADSPVEVAQEIAPGNAAGALLEAGEDAHLIVVGSRGHGGFVEALLGSVSRSVATHSSRPVVVVHGEDRRAGPVVVGVDDSPGNRATLRFAFEAASRREAGLVAVQALPAAYFAPGPPPYPDREESQHKAELQLAERLAGWSDSYPDVPLRKLVRRDHPVTALGNAAEDAQLLVVGHRGQGGFTGLLLGSVATGVLHHARCPVAVVPTARPGQP